MGDHGRWDASGHWLRWDGERPPESARAAARTAAGALAVAALALATRLRQR